LRTLPTATPGEHVCWLIQAEHEYDEGERALIADGSAAGDRILIVGGAADAARIAGAERHVTVFAPQADASPRQTVRSVAGEVRRAAQAAERDGRALRVLARMERLVMPGTSLEELMVHEVGVGEAIAGRTASLVCAYRQEQHSNALLADLAVMHDRIVGAHGALGGEPPAPGSGGGRDARPGFHIGFDAAGQWLLRGVVDLDGARAFSAALKAALALSPHLVLQCDTLEMISAAGLRALVETVTETQGSAVVLTGATRIVRRVWALSGYGAAGIAVEVHE
jgi:anti-anti-sigma regulatory factor